MIVGRARLSDYYILANMDAQADLNLHWAHTHFVGFVMLRLICAMP